MDQTLTGGTDAGSMVVFDPAALPDDFDAKQKDDTFEQLAGLMEAGRLYWLNTAADGQYTLGVYLGDCLPDRLKPFAKVLAAYPRFQVPSGHLYFTGVEYAFRTDDSSLRKYAHMGQAAELVQGMYRSQFFEFEYPEEFEDDVLRQRLPATAFSAHRLMSIAAPVGCLSALVLIGSLFVPSWAVWAAVARLCGLLLIGFPIVLSRLPAYRCASAVHEQIAAEFPAFGVLLHRLGALG
jgi:hypothetical protein